MDGLTRRGFLTRAAATAGLVAGGPLLLDACGSSASGGARSSSTSSISFAYQPGYNYGLYYVAQTKGWFKDVGLSLSDLTIFQQGTVEVDALLAGRFEAAVQGFVPVLTLAASGQPLRIIDVVDNSGATYAIVSQGNIASVPDLAGKTVGVTVGTNYQYFLDSVLAKYGMSEKDLNVINQQPLTAQSAFIAGRLDAIVPITINTQSILAQRAGAKTLFRASQFTEEPNPASTPFTIFDLLVVTADQAQSHRDALRKLVEVFHTKVTDYVENNFQEAVQDIYRWQTTVVKAKVDATEIAEGLRGYQFFDVAEIEKIFGGGQLQQSLSSVSQYLIRQKLLTAKPDLSTVIDSSIVQSL